MKNLIQLLDFFLPRFCQCCKSKLESDQLIACETCLSKIKPAADERLKFEFEKKFRDAKVISGFDSRYLFEKEGELQNLIHALKYEGKFRIGLFLGRKLGEKIEARICDWKPDFIIPVPLHHLKKAERGFNQSYYLAKGMSRFLNIPVAQKYLKRIRFTETQTNLTLDERADNMLGAFKVKKREMVKGKNILIVDDVITTGATVSECAKVLLENGASKVFAASAAVAD